MECQGTQNSQKKSFFFKIGDLILVNFKMYHKAPISDTVRLCRKIVYTECSRNKFCSTVFDKDAKTIQCRDYCFQQIVLRPLHPQLREALDYGCLFSWLLQNSSPQTGGCFKEQIYCSGAGSQSECVRRLHAL